VLLHTWLTYIGWSEHSRSRADLKLLDILSPESAALDPLVTEIVLSSDDVLEAEPIKGDWRGGSNVVSVVAPDLPAINEAYKLTSTENRAAPRLRGAVLESDAADKGLQGILTERKACFKTPREKGKEKEE
jgi:hypothetical protein